MSKKPHEPLYQTDASKNQKWLPETGYFQGDRRILDYAADIKAYGIALYSVLCAHADKNGQCFPSISTLAKKGGMGTTKVREARDLLVKHKIIRYVERKEKGRPTSHLYTMLPFPKKQVDTSPHGVSNDEDTPPDEPTILRETEGDTPQGEGGIPRHTDPNEIHLNESQLSENHLEREGETRGGGDLQNSTGTTHPPPSPRSFEETNNQETPDPYFTAFAHICKIDPQLMSNKQQLQLGEAIQKFKTANIPPYLIYGFEDWWAEFWPNGGHPYISQVLDKWGAYSESERERCQGNEALGSEQWATLKADPLCVAILSACRWGLYGLEKGHLNFLAQSVIRLKTVGVTSTDIYYVEAKIRKEEPEKDLRNATFVVDEAYAIATRKGEQPKWKEDKEPQSQTDHSLCQGVDDYGKPCRLYAGKSGYCDHHRYQNPKAKLKRCEGQMRDGKRCTNVLARKRFSSDYCHVHQGQDSLVVGHRYDRCAGLTLKGEPCNREVKRNSQFCAWHDKQDQQAS